MLYIDDSQTHIQQAKSIHEKNILCYLKRKIYGNTTTYKCIDTKCKICNSSTQKANIRPDLLALLQGLDLEKIVSGTPNEIFAIQKIFDKSSSKLNPVLSDDDLKKLKTVFNYTWFDKKESEFYNAYDLCNNLKIETCVYCNRLYTSTVITDKKALIIRPTLDHWFPQVRFPLLALSFYNLIPSCSPCNSSVKHASNFTLTKNIHPYVDGKVTSNYTLQSTYDKSLATFKIKVDSKDKRILSTLEEMKIADIYEHHQSELADLDLLQRKYNKSYLKDLNKLLGSTLKEKDVYRIMFGVEYEDENFHKRPLSKLKKDILNIKLK